MTWTEKSWHYTEHKKYSAMQEKIKTRWVWNEKLQEHQMVEYGTGKYSFTEEDKISIVSEYVWRTYSGKCDSWEVPYWYTSDTIQLDG